MGYKLKELRVLSGSLNLLTPGDKIAPEDATQMENWRVDQAGALRSRNAVSAVAFCNLSATGDIHTLELRNQTFYMGNGTELFRMPIGLPAVIPPTLPIATGLTGNPFGVAGMNGYAWIMDQNVQKRDDGTTLGDWGITAPPTPATAGSVIGGGADLPLPNGTYRFYSTYGLSDLSESNPSPVSNDVTTSSANLGNFTLTDVAVSTDPRVIVRNIYVEGGDLGQPYLCFTIGDNLSTTATFDFSEEDILEEGQALEFDHDGPPAAAGIVGPYFGSLVAFCSVANPNRMWWTKPGLPEYWPGAALATGQWVDVGDSGEKILGISVKARMLIIYKERSIWRLLGSPDTGTLEVAKSELGIIGPRAFCNAGELDYFASFDGLYFTADGVVCTPFAHDKISPLFLGQFTLINPAGLIQPINPQLRVSCAIKHFAGHVIFSYPEATWAGPGNSCTLLIEVDSGRVATHRCGQTTSNGLNTRGGFTSFLYTGPELWAGNGNTVMWVSLDLAYGPSGWMDFQGLEPIQLAYQSRFEDCGFPDNDKVFLDLVIDYQVGGLPFGPVPLAPAAVSLSVVSDNGQGVVNSLGTLSSSTRTSEPFSLAELECRNLAVRLDCASNQPVIVHGIYLYYYVEARLAVEVVTIPFELAGGEVCEVKELRVDADNETGSFTVALKSDLPGNVLTQRASEIIGAFTTRRTFPAVFNPIKGRLWQFSAISDGANAFRLYGAKLLARVLGNTVDGEEAQQGRTWDSMPIGLGNTHMKAWDQLRFELESDCEVDVALSTDLPGEAMASRFTGVVVPAAGMARAWATVPLPDGIEGRLGDIVLTAPNATGANIGFRVWKAQVRARVVGRYIAAQNGSNLPDMLRTLEYDYQTTRVKEFKKVEIEAATDGAATVRFYTNQNGTMQLVSSQTINTGGAHQVLKLFLPLNARGRLMRVDITSTQPARIYKIRAWIRPVNEPGATWTWSTYPLEESANVPEWVDLPIPEAPGPSDTWQWIAIPGAGDPTIEA